MTHPPVPQRAVRIGFLGAGRMGAPMVVHLAAAGHQVTALARHPAATDRARAAGAVPATTVSGTCADAEVVVVCVLTDGQVQEVCTGPDGAVSTMAPGGVVVIHTTGDPDTAEAIAHAGRERGISVVDAAVSGGPDQVSSGELTLFVGGDAAVLDRVRPLLETYASPVLHVGPLGHGQRVKLVNNALFSAHLGLAAEALQLAASLGVGGRTLLGAVTHGSGASRALAIAAAAGSVQSVSDTVGEFVGKDVALVRAVCARLDVPLGLIGEVLASPFVRDRVLVDRSAESAHARSE